MEILLLGIIVGLILKPSKNNRGGVRSVKAPNSPKPPPPPKQPKVIGSNPSAQSTSPGPPGSSRVGDAS